VKLEKKVINTSESESARIRKVLELIDEIDERSEKTGKIIIFSQFVTCFL
jgi:hypothetical protein